MAPQEAPVRTYMVTDAMLEHRDWKRHQVPAYKTEETARVFFGMSVHWLRRYLRKSKKYPRTGFIFNGQPMEFSRTDPERSSSRVFRLSDVEKMAYSLKDLGVIDDQKLYRTLRVVESQAYLFGLFDRIEEPAMAGQEAS